MTSSFILKKKILVRPRLGFLFSFFFRNFFGLFHSLICWLWKLWSFNIVRSLSISLKLLQLAWTTLPKLVLFIQNLSDAFELRSFFDSNWLIQQLKTILKNENVLLLCAKRKRTELKFDRQHRSHLAES